MMGLLISIACHETGRCVLVKEQELGSLSKLSPGRVSVIFGSLAIA